MVADTIESGEEIEDQIDTNSQENDEILDHDGVSLSINNYWHADIIPINTVAIIIKYKCKIKTYSEVYSLLLLLLNFQLL